MKEKGLEDYKETWFDFWESICTDAEGNVNMDQIKRELHDYHLLMNHVAIVYDHITGGKISKPLTDPQTVIAVADDSYRESFEEEQSGEYSEKLEKLVRSIPCAQDTQACIACWEGEHLKCTKNCSCEYCDND